MEYGMRCLRQLVDECERRDEVERVRLAAHTRARRESSEAAGASLILW